MVMELNVPLKLDERVMWIPA